MASPYKKVVKQQPETKEEKINTMYWWVRPFLKTNPIVWVYTLPDLGKLKDVLLNGNTIHINPNGSSP